MTVRRLPWVSFGIMAVCTAILLVVERGDSLAIFGRFGLVPDDPAPEALLSHIFLHAGWLHLLGNLFLLFLAGPPIEDRWGRPLFSAFFLSAGLASGAFHMAITPGSALPLVGASGAISGVLGACMVCHWNSKIRFAYFFLIPPRFVRGTFWAPAWLMLPLWFAGELAAAALSDDGGSTGGVAYWAHVGGFAYGALFALGIRQWKIEERFIHPVIEAKLTVMTNPTVEAAMEARVQGDPEGAYAMLSDAVAADPGDPEAVTALWELACELRRPERAATALLGIAADALRRGDRELAARYWCEISERAPDVRADANWLVRLVPVLQQFELRREAVTALRHALDTPQGASVGTATRVMELAAELDPHTAAMAARRLLETADLHETRRTRVEQLLAGFESHAARTPTRVAQPERGLEITDRSPIDLPVDAISDRVAVVGRPDGPAATGALELDAAGMLVARSAPEEGADSYIGLPPDQLMHGSPERFASLKVVESVPIALGDRALMLERPDGRRTRLEYDRIQAIAVAALRGLSERPVLVIDLALNWTELDQDILQVVRLRGDRFDVRRLAPGHAGALAAFRAFVAELLARSGATPLPASNGSGDTAFRTFDDLADYARDVLDVAG